MSDYCRAKLWLEMGAGAYSAAVVAYNNSGEACSREVGRQFMLYVNDKKPMMCANENGNG